MPIKPAGSQWLKEQYGLSRYSLTHCSYIGNNSSIELTSKGSIEQIYGTKYAPAADTPLAQLEFALKYDDLDLDFLKTVLEKIPVAEIAAFIEDADKEINLMIVYLHQNKGIFPKRRRDYFARLTDEEIDQMQVVYRKIFELDSIQ